MMDIAQVQSQVNFPDAAEMRRQLSALSTAAGEIRTGMSETEKQALWEAAEAFESFFLQMMFREMRNTLSDENRLIPKSNAERIFTDMLDQETAIQAAQAGGIGLARTIFEQMTRDYSNAVPRQGMLNFTPPPPLRVEEE